MANWFQIQLSSKSFSPPYDRYQEDAVIWLIVLQDTVQIIFLHRTHFNTVVWQRKINKLRTSVNKMVIDMIII